MRIVLDIGWGQQVLIGVFVDRDPAELNQQTECAGLVGAISRDANGLPVCDIIQRLQVIGVNLGRNGWDISDIGQIRAGFIIKDVHVRGVLVDVEVNIIFAQGDVSLAQVGKFRVINLVALLGQDWIDTLAEEFRVRAWRGADANLGGLTISRVVAIRRAARCEGKYCGTCR